MLNLIQCVVPLIAISDQEAQQYVYGMLQAIKKKLFWVPTYYTTPSEFQLIFLNTCPI